MSQTTRLEISGMSCDHCVTAVTAALTAIPGVRHAAVSLSENAATVIHEASVPPSALIGAVTEEGYEARLPARRT